MRQCGRPVDGCEAGAEPEAEDVTVRARQRPGAHTAVLGLDAVDKIIQHILYTKDRDELVAATKALDRVLLWNHYVVAGWGLRANRVARWDRFSHPEPLPEFGDGFPTIWWWDADKAAKAGVPQ